MFVAFLLAKPHFKKRGIPTNHLETLTLILIGSGLIGARLFWVLIDLPYFLQSPLSIFKIWEGGMAFSGGFLLALLSMSVYLKKHGLEFWKVADALALPLVAGMAIGRFGCLLTGLHTGIATNFGPTFMINETTYLAWPAYAILNWTIAFILLSKINNKKWATGTLSHLVLLWWGLWRFSSDFLRISDPTLGGDTRILGLTPTQYLSLLVTITVFMRLLKLIRVRAKI